MSKKCSSSFLPDFSGRTFVTDADLEAMGICKRQTAAKWRMLGQGPAFIRAGRSVKYPVALLLSWLDSNTVGDARAAAKAAEKAAEAVR